MLDILDEDSPYRVQHLAESTMKNLSQSDPSADESDPKQKASQGKFKKMAKKRKHKHSSKYRTKKRFRIIESSEKGSENDDTSDFGSDNTPPIKNAEIRAFQKVKRKRLRKQSETSFLASVISDTTKDDNDKDEEEKENEEEEEEEEEVEEKEDEERSEDETVFPLNQTVNQSRSMPKVTFKSGKISIEIDSDDSTLAKKSGSSPPHHSPKYATEDPVSRTEFQNLASVVQALDSKSETILKAVQGLAASVPSLVDREKQLDQLIKLRQPTHIIFSIQPCPLTLPLWNKTFPIFVEK
ncbi:hypothetical protein LXL04_020521 [Taraxacum kok-saghyz]